MKMKCLFLFCNDLAKDPVSPRIFDQCLKTLPLRRDFPGSILGNPVLVHETRNGSLAYLAAIPHVASYRWSLLLPDLLRDFKDMAQIVIVNWHEGAKAPERIFCGHTVGDVPSGNFASANPALLCSLLHSVEKKRKERGLDDWSTLLEATHWSGIPQGGRVDEMLSPGIPVIDFEIGSYPQDWSFAPAIEVMAEAIADFDEVPQASIDSLIFCGGEHFERGASQPLFRAAVSPIFFSHHLPNQWLVSGNYSSPEGVEKVLSAASSVIGGVRGIVFHDNLKSGLKDTVRSAAQRLGVPIFSHKRLRDPNFVLSLSKPVIA